MALDRWFDAATLTDLRQAVFTEASVSGLPRDQAVGVVLAVHELAANTVRHGAGAGLLAMRTRDGRLYCQVSDAGPAGADAHNRGADPAAAPPWPVRPGHGLWIVHAAADHVSVASGPDGSQVTAVFTLPGLRTGNVVGSDHSRQPKKGQGARCARFAGARRRAFGRLRDAMTEPVAPVHVTADPVKNAYDRISEPVDPVAVIVTCANGGDKAGCLVTFSGPCSLHPPRCAVWLSHCNHTYSVALVAEELIVHLLSAHSGRGQVHARVGIADRSPGLPSTGRCA